MRFATIDVGTNTAQLLVVDADGDGHRDSGLQRVVDVERFVRLGEGVDARGRIGAAAQERLLQALRQHVDTARAHGAEEIVAVATSAMRDAANRTAVCHRIEDELGLCVEVLSGDDEATWSFAAACAPFDDLSGDVLVVDVGGGSTELVVGHNPSGHGSDIAAAITARVSLDAGCVRLTERCFDTHPPSDAGIRKAEAAIEDALAAAEVTVGRDAVLVGTAGTATALALVHAGPDSGETDLRRRVEQEVTPLALSAADIRTWRERLLARTVEEIHALHPQAMNGRADVFPVGVMLLDHIVRRTGLEPCRVSPYELRHGIALRVLQARRAP